MSESADSARAARASEVIHAQVDAERPQGALRADRRAREEPPNSPASSPNCSARINQ